MSLKVLVQLDYWLWHGIIVHVKVRFMGIFWSAGGAGAGALLSDRISVIVNWYLTHFPVGEKIVFDSLLVWGTAGWVLGECSPLVVLLHGKSQIGNAPANRNAPVTVPAKTSCLWMFCHDTARKCQQHLKQFKHILSRYGSKVPTTFKTI